MADQTANENRTDFEVAIVGGGPAGLSAALTLGRARRNVVLFDAGSPRNAPSPAAHNVFTRDGASPLELNRIGREQLSPYSSVQVRELNVADVVRRKDDTFELRSDDDGRVTAQQLIFATGLVDELPQIPGLRELWGTGVFHCPYCHGWEVRDQPFVLIAQSPRASHLVHVLRGWSENITLCASEGFEIGDEERQSLTQLGVRIRPAVEAVVGGAEGRVADVVLVDGERLGPAAVFTTAPVRQRSSIPQQLGCTVHGEGMFAGLIKVDERGFSGVPGIWVVGDASQGFPQVIAAAYEGTLAGAMINNELLMAGQLPSGVRAPH